MRRELNVLGLRLEKEPELGNPLGNGLFKIRLGIKRKGKGKSGGGRVITYFLADDGEVYLLTIYDKSEFESVDDRTLGKLVENLEFDRN